MQYTATISFNPRHGQPITLDPVLVNATTQAEAVKAATNRARKELGTDRFKALRLSMFIETSPA